jgi:hypothetical protein
MMKMLPMSVGFYIFMILMLQNEGAMEFQSKNIILGRNMSNNNKVLFLLFFYQH